MTAALKRQELGTDAAVAALPQDAAMAEAGARPTVIVLNKQELLGEALQRIPAYRALRLAFPEHRIVCLAQGPTAFADAFASVRGLFMDETVPASIRSGNPLVLRRLAQSFGRIDVVIDFRSNLRLVASWFAFYPVARRYIANGAGLTTRKGVRGFAEVRPQSHAERYHRMVEIVAGRRLPFDPGLPVLPEAEALARRLLPDGGRYFGFAGSPKGSFKSWPRERLVPVAAHVRQLGLTPVVLLGKDETSERDWYAANIPGAVIIDLADAGGDPNFLVWVLHAAAGRLAGCLANENGLGHLVASTGVPLVTLAGPTNPIRWRPLTRSWWPVRAQDFGSEKMADIPVAAVEEAVTAMIGSRERGAPGNARKAEA
jgi:ADP-heptose:LPS heptosyltransferase